MTIGAAVALSISLRHASVRKSGTGTTSAASPISAANARPASSSGTLSAPARAGSCARARAARTGTRRSPGTIVAPAACGAASARCSTPFWRTTTAVRRVRERPQRGRRRRRLVRLDGEQDPRHGRRRVVADRARERLLLPPGSSSTGAGPGARPYRATSCPARSAAAPKVTPTAPGPITAMLVTSAHCGARVVKLSGRAAQPASAAACRSRRRSRADRRPGRRARRRGAAACSRPRAAPDRAGRAGRCR